MATPEEIIIVDSWKNSDHKERILKTMMKMYAEEGIFNSRELLRFSNELVDMIIEQEYRRKQELHVAIKMLMFQRSIEESHHKEDPGIMFGVMLPVCKVAFPNGKSDIGSVAKEKYFNKFCDLLQNEEAFSWEKDKEWAEDEGYAEYIRLIESQI